VKDIEIYKMLKLLEEAFVISFSLGSFPVDKIQKTSEEKRVEKFNQDLRKDLDPEKEIKIKPKLLR